MKLKKTCETCYYNQRDCSYLLGANCLQYGLCDWEPYTNADHIKSMCLTDLAKFLCNFANCDYCPASGRCDVVESSGFRKWLNERVKLDEQS